jgi:hypothetical protein
VRLSHVPPEEWRECLQRFSRAHRAWLATVHRVAGDGTVDCLRQAAFESLTLDEPAAGAAVRLRLLDGSAFRLGQPQSVRIQVTDVGAETALEIEAAGGGLLRLAFRATVLPHELDGLAPREVVELQPTR